MNENTAKIDILRNDFIQLTTDGKDRILRTAKKLHTIQMSGYSAVFPDPAEKKKTGMEKRAGLTKTRFDKEKD
jgi:hypothetical protein